MPIIIAADDIKKKLPNYSPDKAEAYHHESAKKADKLFTEALKDPFYKNVILLSGGTASGKSEFLATQLINKDSIIMDATLSTELGAQNKIRQILKSGKTPTIYTVVPDDLKRAFIAFLNRDRKFNNTHFYKTHSGSRKTILSIVMKYPDIHIHIIESSYDAKEKIQFDEIAFVDNNEMIKYLTGLQLNEDDIISLVNLKE